jgi:hypothetical protein
VVDVAERGAAPGGAAQVLVAGLDEVRERGGGEAGAGVEADELSGPGSDVEAADPGARGAGGVGDEGPGPGGGHGSVADEVRGVVCCVEEGAL